jgi:uncharacterized protein with NAD-binding domain and iron-sulfur cluster
MAANKTRVAILGGGVGALTAAYALTEVDPQGEKFEITIYQLGWRLGGKTASGRNADYGERIEEHGLHIWAGFYENAFTVLRSALKALDRPPGSPQATIGQAFERQNQVFLTEDYEGQWLPWPIWFQPDPDPTTYPGRDDLLSPPDSVMPSLSTLLARALAALAYNFEYYKDEWGGDPRGETAAKIAAMPLRAQAKIATTAATGPGHPLMAISQSLAAEVTEGLDSVADDAQAALIAALSAFHDLVRARLAGSGLSTEFRRYLIMLGFGLRIGVGVLANHCFRYGLHVLDQFEFRQFLGQFWPLDPNIDNALVASLYDYTFAYSEGEQPTMSACTAVQGVLRMFVTYKGAFFYKATAGMGDTICTPLYEVMRRRGVNFRFFHQVTGLHPTPDGFNVGSITMNRQVGLALGVAEYEPVHNVNGLPCWPSTPRWDLLEDGRKLGAAGVDFEDVLDPLPPPAAELTLTLGEDFDQVILGISMGSLAELCAPLAAVNAAWADMVVNLPTTRTQAFQMWLDCDVTSLGGPYVQPPTPPPNPGPWWPIMPPPFPPGPSPASPVMGPISAGYLKPFDTYADMSQLLAAEAWPTPTIGPKSIAYFCSTMPDDAAPNQQAAADAVVKQNALGWMGSSLATLWPNIVRDGAFQWQLLHAQGEISGPARFDEQFWQANINPSERYVLSLPGTLQHRMEPGDSGFDNLFLAGDWTKVPDINAGCVEVATMSGLAAASALSGVEIPIVASSTLYIGPQFVNFAGWTSLPPPPSVCTGAQVYSWGFKADHAALQRFLDRSFNRVAGRRRFRPLLDMAFMAIVQCQALSPGTPPFSLEGSMAETDIGFWILVGAYDLGDVIPSSVAWLPAYLFVDNAFTSASGREIWGFPKFVSELSVPAGPRSSGPFEASAVVIKTFAPTAAASLQQLLSMQGSDIRFTGLNGASLEILKLVSKVAHPSLLSALDTAHAASPFLPGVGGLPAPVYFLKQFHSGASTGDACYQQILKGALILDRMSGVGLLTGKWQLELGQFDSLPFIRDLGLGTPVNGALSLETDIGFWAEVDFTLGMASPF